MMWILVPLIVLPVLTYFLSTGLLETLKSGIEVTRQSWLLSISYRILGALGIGGILDTAVVLLGFLLIPILGVTFGDKRRLFRVVNKVVIVALVIWAILLISTCFLSPLEHM